MGNPWDGLREGVLEVLRAEAQPLFRAGGQAARWTAEVAEELAREWWRAANAATQEERQAALANVEALKTAALIRAASHSLSFKRQGRGVLERIMRVVVGIVVQAVVSRAFGAREAS